MAVAEVYGTGKPDILDAADGVTNDADLIFGFGGNDTIFGLGGHDALTGGGGADTLNGGEGYDWAQYYDSTAAGVTVNLESGRGFGGTAEGDTLVSIEHVSGSPFGDKLTGNAGNNVLVGRFGNDLLKGGGGDDEVHGDDDDDTLKGGGGADVLVGGHGIDTASYFDSPTGVIVRLDTGVAILGDAEGDTLYTIENLTGSDFADHLWGNDSANVLNGLGGNDQLRGYGGADIIWGGEGNDILIGMEGGDTLYGENGNDILRGEGGFDYLYGGAGNDLLIGGEGQDTMFGGADADTFSIRTFAEAPPLGYMFTDYIPDFSSAQGDKIDLSALDANLLIDGDQAFVPVGVEVAFNGIAGELRFNGGFLEGDANGDGLADFQIELDVASLNATDLVL